MPTAVEMLEALKEFDTPSITNVVATYPKNPLCLALYNPWYQNWYTDASLRCWYPELGRVVGYAVTAVYGMPDPAYTRPWSLADVVEAMEESPKPTVFVFEQRLPPEILRKNGLSGGNMTTAFKAAGCVGAITNGPSRDIDEIRPMGFQYLTAGVCAGHGEFQLQALQVPVSVAGMDVAPGEIIHMDENGAVKFPAKYLAEVLDRVTKLRDQEAAHMERVRGAKDLAALKDVLGGGHYAAGKK